MTTLEQELMERIIRLDVDKQHRILKFIETIEKPRTYTAIELMQFPPEERREAVAASFAAGQHDRSRPPYGGRIRDGTDPQWKNQLQHRFLFDIAPPNMFDRGINGSTEAGCRQGRSK